MFSYLEKCWISALDWFDLALLQMKLTELFMRLDHGSLDMGNLSTQPHILVHHVINLLYYNTLEQFVGSRRIV